MNELHITSEIEHPSIVRIHCAMQDDKYLYFLLDLLPGECRDYMCVSSVEVRQPNSRSNYATNGTRWGADGLLKEDP